MCENTNEEEIINEVIRILTEDNKIEDRYSSDIDGLKNRIYQIKQNKYRLGVIGVTSSGKSTMINAFLGEHLLPGKTAPSSSQLVSCFRDSKRQAKVFFADENVFEYTDDELTSEIICKYGDEFYNEDNKYKVNHIEITTPDFPFSDDLLLVDSPGLGAYGFENHETLTLNSLLPTIDFCIFLTTCKANSDAKMKSVLDLVAEYNKPVLIVQNMIDSIYETANRAESVSEIAQAHVARIEKIIEASELKDKAQVKIVQISAKWALDSITEKKACRNKNNSELEAKFKKSNFDLLVSSINSILESVKPRIENQRKASLKRELDKIIQEAEEDGKGENLSSLVFEFENLHDDIQEKISIIRRTLNSVISELQNVKDEVGKKEKSAFSFLGTESYSYVPSQAKLNSITKKINESAGRITDEIKSFNLFAENICKDLNIDSRNIFNFEATTKMPKIEMVSKTETKWVDKDGLGNAILRFFDWGNNGWGQEAVPEKVDDVEGTIKKTINAIQLEEKALRNDTENWLKSVAHTCSVIDEQIEIKRKAFEQRKTKALDAEQYRMIAKEIRTISTDIQVQDITSSKYIHEEANIYTEPTEEREFKKYIFPIYRMAEIIKDSIGNESVKSFCRESTSVVIGWDRECESSFVKQYLHTQIDVDLINDGENSFRNLLLFHNPDEENKIVVEDSQNIFILVNAIQIGSALEQINKSEICKRANNTNKVFFVIQDFQELITSDSVNESISNMLEIGKSLNYSNEYKILINHDNPIFNIMLLELQQNGCNTHSDEINLIHTLQKELPYLRNTEIDNVCEEIIKGYKKENINV